MASINEIQVKGIKDFKDHEGYTIHQGTIYYKGKKLGSWSQDYMYGPDHFDFDESILEGEVKSYAAKSEFVDDELRKVVNLQCLLSDLMALNAIEKSYKRYSRQGYKSYAIVGNSLYNYRGWFFKQDKETCVKTQEYKNLIKTYTPMYKHMKTFVFGEQKDFNPVFR